MQESSFFIAVNVQEFVDAFKKTPLGNAWFNNNMEEMSISSSFPNIPLEVVAGITTYAKRPRTPAGTSLLSPSLALAMAHKW